MRRSGGRDYSSKAEEEVRKGVVKGEAEGEGGGEEGVEVEGDKLVIGWETSLLYSTWIRRSCWLKTGVSLELRRSWL